MARNTFILAIIGVLCLVVGRPAAAAPPRVVASIKPLHSLVAGVMAGVAVPDLLVNGGASPHTYTLKPSDADRLSRARVIFWIGPGLEQFLEKPLTTLAPSAKVVALIDAPGLTLIGKGADIDRHIWLDPINAKAMVAVIAGTLVAIDPENAARYSANAAALATRLDALNVEIDGAVAPVRTRPFIVFHDAYQYFMARYHVNVIGSVTVTPDRAPGARHVAEIRERITASGAACVFTEPEFAPKLINTLTEGTQARTGVLDPEGTALTPGPDLYFTLMRKLTENLTGCLSSR